MLIIYDKAYIYYFVEHGWKKNITTLSFIFFNSSSTLPMIIANRSTIDSEIHTLYLLINISLFHNQKAFKQRQISIDRLKKYSYQNFDY